jgi:hypothetical protein
MRGERASLRQFLVERRVLASTMAAACLLLPAAAHAAAEPEPEPHAFVPASLIAAAEEQPDAVFSVIVQGREGKSSRGVADEVAAERTRTPGKGKGLRRQFRSISGVAAELTGKQLLKLAKKRWIFAITPDARMVATEGLAPLNTVPPTVSGSAQEGGSLSAGEGVWTGTAPLTFTYRWQRCDTLGDACVDSDGATVSAYALTSADVGQTVRVVVTASDTGGSASAVSAASPVVVPALPFAPVNVLAPTSSGVAQVGESLSSSEGLWSGSFPIAHAFQWQRCSAAGDECTDIEGATTAGYTLGEADTGLTVRVTVTATNAGGATSAASDASAVIAPPPAPVSPAVPAPPPFAPTLIVAPVLTGLAQAGELLSAGEGVWSGGFAIAFAFQWQRCSAAGEECADMEGATTAGYTLGEADSGLTVRVTVTATNAGGATSAASDASAVIVPALPVVPTNLAAPALTGAAQDGETLTASEGSWTGTLPIALAYQWQRCDALGEACADIESASSTGYTLTADDVGATVRAVATASNAGGSATSATTASEQVAPAAVPPTNTETPTIAGTARDGETLTAGGSSWSGTEPIDYAYQWQRCDALGHGCADIPDADTARHTLGAEDVGAAIRLTVTAANAGGSATAASAASAQVEPLAPANVLPPAVVGGAEEGLMLTAAEGGWTGTRPLAYTYQWQRCDAGACTDIPGATHPTYLIATLDLGAALQVVVTATNAAGAAAAAALPTATVIPAPELTGYSTRQLWPYATGVAALWTPAEPSTPAPTIAIVDSGIDAGRADFDGRVLHEVTLTTLTPNAPGDGRGHGTFVASIAAGEAPGYTGAYPQANLVSIDVMDDDGEATTSDVIAAADWIYQNKDAYGIRVANFSLTGSVDSSFRFDPVNKAVEKLWLSGVVVVVAAGNYAEDGRESGVRFSPGVDPFVITVGATDVNGTVSTSDDFAAPWSAYGHTHDGFAKPELSAPGRYVVGAVPPGSRFATERPERLVAPGYMQLSGTSFSAPMVSGAAAALLAAHPAWTPDEVKGALMLSADPTAAVPAFAAGVGALDAAGAAAVAEPPNPNDPLNDFLVADPDGGPEPVFDEPGWSAAVSADPAWGSSHWGSSHWGSASWSVSHWGSASWSASHWGSSHWGSSHWGSDATWSGDSHWGSATNNAADDVLPGGGYWLPRSGG